jgi:hypothetical protein
MGKYLKFIMPLFSVGLYLSFASYNSQYVTISEIALWGLFALAFGLVVMLAVWKIKNQQTQIVLGFIVLLWFYSWGYICKWGGGSQRLKG